MTGERPRRRRLYFALWPDEGLRVEIHRVARSAVRQCHGRAVPARHYHLTLAFLGAVRPELVDPILDCARDLPLESFVLDLDRYGYFPESRVFWIGPAEAPLTLANHVDQLWDRLEDLGLPRPAEPFQPHVSLCRRVAAPPEVEAPEPVVWRPTGYVLVESEPGSAGARYQVIGRFPDTGA